MRTKVKQETPHEFDRRMIVERFELGKAIREQNYDRAAVIAQYILNEVQVRRHE